MDIYGDLDNFDFSKRFAEVENEKNILEESAIKTSEEIKKLQKINEELLKKNENLENNISTLFKTAKHELTRKENTIKRLQEEVDMLTLRMKTQSSRQNKTKPQNNEEMPRVENSMHNNSNNGLRPESEAQLARRGPETEPCNKTERTGPNNGEGSRYYNHRIDRDNRSDDKRLKNQVSSSKRPRSRSRSAERPKYSHKTDINKPRDHRRYSPHRGESSSSHKTYKTNSDTRIRSRATDSRLN